jgi:ABC-type transport system involved in multi-copper enzyme maturation permease subunit
MNKLAHPPLVAQRSKARRSSRGGGFTGLLWLTWRQHRWALVASLATAATLTGWMAHLATEMTTLYHQCHDTLCPGDSPRAATLNAAFGPVSVSNDLLLAVQLLPLLIGIFIGVPLLAREHEQRTLLLAWSQDITPARWLWTKLALLGVLVAALTAGISAVSDHLAHVLTTVGSGNMFSGPLFLDSGMLPLALSTAWFAVGVALGAATRRTLPAAMSAIAGFVALTVTVYRLYPTLVTPLSHLTPLGGSTDPDAALGANALILKGGIIIGTNFVSNLFDSSGHALNYTALQTICPGAGADTVLPCGARNHLTTLVQYQPGSRIPDFHLILASGYLGIGVLALAVVWLIVRRTSLSAG